MRCGYGYRCRCGVLICGVGVRFGFVGWFVVGLDLRCGGCFSLFLCGFGFKGKPNTMLKKLIIIKYFRNFTFAWKSY